MTNSVMALSLQNSPALIERLFPVQKLSAEAYKEQMAVQGKTLTALGSYWKGRKPLILNKACILGCLLPATSNPARDIEIFEKLMAMDDESIAARWKRRPKPREILASQKLSCVSRYFSAEPTGVLPDVSPIDFSKPEFEKVKVNWRKDLGEGDRRRLEALMLPDATYRERIDVANRPEEVNDVVHDHIWPEVNAHLGTEAYSLPDLVEQLGIMRFGRRPRFSDTFSGSGQIPFEAARLGCDVTASDLNPVACMLTWGAFNVVGGTNREALIEDQNHLIKRVQAEIDQLKIETDGNGWYGKVYLYCVEARCPQSGWMVPLLPSLIVSKGQRVVVDLIPDAVNKRYSIEIRTKATAKQFAAAKQGTVRTDGRGQDPYLVHAVDGHEFRTKISTLRGDFRKDDGSSGNRLRMWEKGDITPRPDDIFQERLYCIQWMRPKKKGKGDDYEFRTVTADDLRREKQVIAHVEKHLEVWQADGWVPDTRIEPGDKTDEPIRTRGWLFWHQLFNPRQLLLACLINQHSDARLKLAFAQVLNASSRLTRWSIGDGDGRSGGVKGTFDNQALNTLFNYGSRGSRFALDLIKQPLKSFPLRTGLNLEIRNQAASEASGEVDVFVTDPPYGDSVKYEEILEFFISWIRKSPPAEFSHWIWDSRRSLAITGENENFRRSMVAAYRKMTECMHDGSIEVIMFTHQSGSIWADMANIVWASGLHVTAAWYVVTETDNALREGSYVKGTVLLVLRKRDGSRKTTRDDLAWEIKEEVENQVQALSGLNQEAKQLYRNENVFEDADVQMAGYAAALRVLTGYGVIDGRDMTAEAIRPRVKGETTFVDGLIAFAVDTANECLVPEGILKSNWYKLKGAERFYLKMIDMESRAGNTLDNYQNFAKAYKVRDFQPMMANKKAKTARLKGAVEFGRGEMGEGSQFNDSVLRAVLYAQMELAQNVEPNDVVSHLTLNISNWYADMSLRELVIDLAGYLAKRLEELRPDESSAARVLRDLVKNQRLG